MVGRIRSILKKVTLYLEIIIAILLSLGVIIGLLDFREYFTHIFTAGAVDSYDIFQSFLGYALLLIVGIELILMILYHSTSAILELILFVIARKMLIYASSMTDLVLGTVAISLVFVVMRFLVNPQVDEFVSRHQVHHFSGLTALADIRDQTGISLPQDQDQAKTIEDLLIKHAEHAHVPIEEDESYRIGPAIVTVKDLAADGKVNKVSIEDADDSH